jgi:hypothetical protein
MLIDENDVELAERMANALERIQERQDECEYDEDAVDCAERMVAALERLDELQEADAPQTEA